MTAPRQILRRRKHSSSNGHLTNICSCSIDRCLGFRFLDEAGNDLGLFVASNPTWQPGDRIYRGSQGDLIVVRVVDAESRTSSADTWSSDRLDVVGLAAKNQLRGSAAALFDLLAPALLVLVGADEYERVSAEVRELDDEDELFTLLTGLDLPIPAEELRLVARGAGAVDELRRALDITLADFNSALRELGRPLIHYTDEHAQAFATFIATHRDDLLPEVRRAFLPLFTAGRSSRRATASQRTWLGGANASPAALPSQADRESRNGSDWTEARTSRPPSARRRELQQDRPAPRSSLNPHRQPASVRPNARDRRRRSLLAASAPRRSVVPPVQRSASTRRFAAAAG